jgi:hypothetical protein
MSSRLARFPGPCRMSLYLVESDPEHSTWLALWTDLADAHQQRSQPSPSGLAVRPSSHVADLQRLFRSP